MDQPEHVDWRPWGEEAFAVAEETGRPVLLSLVVPWSEECREMDETTYAEPRIAAHIGDEFVPVRADADRRPRVRERYNMGGFPSTVFLTPTGRVLAGATFLGVDGFRTILKRVRETWDEQGEAAGSVPRALRENEPPDGEASVDPEEHMIEQLLGAFDEEYGGWGGDRKFPMPQAVEFALVRDREQALRTLEAVQTHLLDTYDGGYYRLARNRNWRGARREKLADENAALVRAFAHAYRYTGEESYREAARRGVDVLTSTLWTGDAVGASQGGDESYFRLEPTEREEADPPAVDQTILADRNGLVVDGLLWFHAYTDDQRARTYATRTREYLVSKLVEDGRVTHHDASGTDRPAESEAGLLLDQARVLTGLTTSWQVLGEPGPAREVADWTLERLQDDGGALCDGPGGGAGLCAEPLYPLDTGVECADALFELGVLTGEKRYRQAAAAVVAAFAGATDRMGVELAQYASVAARLDQTRVLAVGAPAGSDLHRAALRLADHEAVVVPDSGRADSGRVRLVVDGDRQGSADSPAELEELLTG